MPDTRVLVVDDERSMRELLAIMLKQAGHDVTVADGGEAAIRALQSNAFDLVITDLRMRQVDGLAVLRAAKEHSPQTVDLVVTAFASTETAVEAMKLGAYDYLTKPFKLDEIKLTIANALERKRLQDENQALKRQLRRQRGFENFIGKSRQMLDIFDTIRKAAEGVSTVLVTGESGTDKELVARAIHDESPRRNGPFVSVNCGAIPETLMESELFGHAKGAFTGAVADTVGLFSAAAGGTLFLDEITEVPPSVQVKLLRAIQEREIRRVGDGLRHVTVRRGDQPNVDLEVARVADATDLALLDRAQELDLDRRRDLGDLVEEERPAGRRREEPDRVGHRSREGAFRVAKELGLHERLGDRA